MKVRLTRAFKEKNLTRILRLSADIGHYIADAHVPLHTTENYDGQLTDQHGNTITMNADGITLKSEADFNIEASGDVKIKGSAVDVQ